MDWAIGEVMETLAELKLDENTLVIFASDNGPLFRPHESSSGSTATPGGDSRKRTAPRGKYIDRRGRRARADDRPLAWPHPRRHGVGGNRRRLRLASDVRALAGGEVPKDRIIDGKDILPLLTDDGAKSPHQHSSTSRTTALEGVRQGKWKLRLVDHAH